MTVSTQAPIQSPAGTLQFDGKEVLDGTASDPVRMGWMQGSPPPVDKRIRFEDDRFYGFPQIRWSLSHARELSPTVNVERGDTPGFAITSPSAAEMAAIDALTFTAMDGKPCTWGNSLADTYTDGMLVLHKGRCVYERYFGELKANRPHACFSITKSYACTLAATLVHAGVLDDTKLIPHYLPEMAHTAYANATLRQVMDMQIGVAYSELYSDPKAQIWDYARAGGFRARPADYSGPSNFYEFLVTLQAQGQHGEAFAYKTVNTELLCWIMKRVTGIGLAQMLSEQIWSRIGCEYDAYLAVDSIGVPMGGGGLSATLRDLARFGELMRRGGDCAGVQVIPEAVIADIRQGCDVGKFSKAGYALLPGYSYRNMWWVTHNAHGGFEARGIHGQRLYVAPGADLVVARFASHPVAASAANDPITQPAMMAMGHFLNAR